METDLHHASRHHQLALDYWAMPEVALLLRLVSLINLGTAVVICLWLVVRLAGHAEFNTAIGGAAAHAQGKCQCKLLLVPIPPRARQIVDLETSPRT